MRILYIDIDTLRADRLGCYGYHRATSPNIDALAAQGIRFDGCYASDVPCLPSRTALLTGRFGIHTGVVSHGGTAAEPHIDGASRGFFSTLAKTSWPASLRRAGMRTVSLSSFAERHSAYHWHAGFQETNTVGKRGLENADEVHALARDWLQRNGAQDNWFLHVHMWDPHTPYRVPEAYGNPFADDPPVDWITPEVRERHWQGVGPHSAQETVGFSDDYPWGDFPRQPRQADSMDAVRRIQDGYDVGVRYADEYVGRIMEELERLGVLDDTAIMVSADHGETLGELNIYCDHHTADEHTARVPMILRWPGLAAGEVRSGLHYQFDVAATLLELVGGTVPDNWDARSFAPSLRAGADEGRSHLVLSQGAWTCQRSVRFDQHLYLRTTHDGFHGFPDEMLFDLAADPHEQHDLATAEPTTVERAAKLLDAWHAEMLSNSDHPDPFDTVLREGGPFHTRGRLPEYLQRLRATGRERWAQRLAERHPGEVDGWPG